jgi:hypothetical protein
MLMIPLGLCDSGAFMPHSCTTPGLVLNIGGVAKY